MNPTFTLFCAISVDSAGVAIGQSIGVAGVVKPGLGQYTVQLTDESGPSELTTTVAIRGNTPGIVAWQPNIAGTELEVSTYDVTGAPTDFAFDVLCYRMVQ